MNKLTIITAIIAISSILATAGLSQTIVAAPGGQFNLSSPATDVMLVNGTALVTPTFGEPFVSIPQYAASAGSVGDGIWTSPIPSSDGAGYQISIGGEFGWLGTSTPPSGFCLFSLVAAPVASPFMGAGYGGAEFWIDPYASTSVIFELSPPQSSLAYSDQFTLRRWPHIFDGFTVYTQMFQINTSATPVARTGPCIAITLELNTDPCPPPTLPLVDSDFPLFPWACL